MKELLDTYTLASTKVISGGRKEIEKETRDPLECSTHEKREQCTRRDINTKCDIITTQHLHHSLSSLNKSERQKKIAVLPEGRIIENGSKF